MSSARLIAAQVLPHFADAVIAGKRLTYGRYAKLIGRDVTKESITIGPAMHLIGALCVFRQIPIAPLFYVKRSDREARRIFTSDVIESTHALPHFGELYVAAREYRYSKSDFDGLEKSLREVMLEKAPPDWSPHRMWHFALLRCPEGSQQTYFQRALQAYGRLLDDCRG